MSFVTIYYHYIYYHRYFICKFKTFCICCAFFLFSCTDLNKTVEIYSQPTAAKVYVNDKFIGLTPIKTELLSGAYPIKISKSGFFPYLSNCRVTSNQSLHFVLEKHTAIVVIDYNLKPEIFFFNNKQIAPLKKLTSPIGSIKVFAYKKGYPLIKKSLMIKANKKNYLKINFAKTGLEARLRINSNPPNAQVLLYGMKLATTPVKFNNLSAGIYKWQLKKEGYKSEFIDVSLKKKEEKSFKVNLIQNKVKLEIKTAKGGHVSIYRESKDFPILFANIDSNGFNSQLLPGAYLVEYRPISMKRMVKKLQLYQDTIVTFPDKNKLQIVETNLTKEMQFPHLLFIIAGQNKVYFIDAEKGVVDAKGIHYLAPVFTSDWKNCLVSGVNLYLSDSLNIFQGNMSRKDTWQEIYQSQTGFINGIYPLGRGFLVSTQDGSWSFFSDRQRLKVTQRLKVPTEDSLIEKIFSIDKLKQSISNREIVYKTFSYEEGCLYLLTQNLDILCITQTPNEVKIKIVTLPEIDGLGQGYNFLQVQGSYIYLWSQTSSSIHLYTKEAVYLESFKLSLPGVVSSFALQGDIFYLGVKNEVFCFKMIENL